MVHLCLQDYQCVPLFIVKWKVTDSIVQILYSYCHLQWHLLRLLNESSVFCVLKAAGGRHCHNSRGLFYLRFQIKISSLRKKGEPLRVFRVSLTNTQMQLITFHPFQTKPVSQHLFSCHSPLGAPDLRTTAGFCCKTGKVSFTPLPWHWAAGEEWSDAFAF